MPGNLHCGRVCTLRLWKCRGRRQHFFSAVFAARAPAMGTARTERGSSHSSWKGSRLLSTTATAACLTCRPDIVCPNRLGGMMQPAKAAHGAFLARRKLASGSSRAPCAFPNLRCYPRCWLFSCLGLWSHPHISPKEHQKERCDHSRSQRSFITFHGALRNILLSTGFSAVFPRIASNFVRVNITFELFFLRDKLNWP